MELVLDGGSFLWWLFGHISFYGFLLEYSCNFETFCFFSEHFTVPVEATAFLAAVSAFAVFLLVIFIYVNKKWRILNVGIGGTSGTSGKSGRSHGIQKAPDVPTTAHSADIRNDKLDGTLQFTSPLSSPSGTGDDVLSFPFSFQKNFSFSQSSKVTCKSVDPKGTPRRVGRKQKRNLIRKSSRKS